MEKVITSENLSYFAYVNDKVCTRPIKGIALVFSGLGFNSMCGDTEWYEGELFGSKGILYVQPYHNPWAWMNKQEVDLTDEILDVIFEKFDLPENTPIASTGGSMGGLGAITYCAYAKRTPITCVANCPVCDALFHYNERDDLPRTMYSAVYGYEGTLNEALASLSPIHLVDKLPKITYHIFHCDEDRLVNISHSDRFVNELKKGGFSYTYDIQHGRNHGDLDYEHVEKYRAYIIDEILGR